MIMKIVILPVFFNYVKSYNRDDEKNTRLCETCDLIMETKRKGDTGISQTGHRILDTKNDLLRPLSAVALGVG